MGPAFDRLIPADGYAWWYLDALSDDGKYGLCVIASLGSVFSPYYAAGRRAGRADPLHYSSFNVSLSGRPTRWSMTERPRSRVVRTASSLQIGPSAMDWNGEVLTYRIAEHTCPLPMPLRGELRVRPTAMPEGSFALDAAGRHVWSPLAPRARIEVEFTRPRLTWEGDAYLDANHGERPLEADFAGWTWSRAAGPARTTVFYDVDMRDGATRALALHVDKAGAIEPAALPARHQLPASGWRIRRQARSEVTAPRLIRTLVDAPFYARSLLATRLAGSEIMTVHESLDLGRFRRRWVQSLLPFRMPRWPLRG